MNDIKPKFFISHDAGGLFLWLSRERPKMNQKSGRYEAADAAKMCLPYSWFGHMMRENTIHAVDIEAMTIWAEERKPISGGFAIDIRNELIECEGRG